MIDRGERLLRRTIGALVRRPGDQLRLRRRAARRAGRRRASTSTRPSIGPLTFGQGSLGGINVYGQATAVQQGSYVSLGVYRVNALALDPNHLGIMLCVPILLLLPFALRAGRAHAAGASLLAALLGVLRRWSSCSRSRARACSASACGLLVLAWPLRRQLLAPRVVVPVLGGARARRRRAWPRRPTCGRSSARASRLSDNSAKVHFQFFDLVQPVLDAHPVFGLGLNTFSVYYQFLTGKTNWGPHSFYIALLDETGLVGAVVFAAFLAWLGIRLAVILRASRALRAPRRRARPATGARSASG